MSPRLILASTSPFRKQLLAKLNIPFDTCSPDINESPYEGESPENLVMRLAQEKAIEGASQYTQGLVIGSDQVAVINGTIVGKPHTHEKAVEQLTRASNQIITFYTGLTLHNISTGQSDTRVETFNVHFRKLTPEQIEYYLQTERPYFCAGSFKCEGLGIALFTQLEGKDPNTLVGLPLITLIDMLATQGYEVLTSKPLV
ncbi:Maf-like protein [Shewanella sp. D64]|uniref:Maf family protein n=1 Tax=unclassified Shewanella TaxID=196818 RepID=UPI0022BA57C1|nr:MULTISPECIES: nucleoside triphosphate pyrophosphatase [unclassified Shewanella]MEC4724870.1 Maf-like protein [Shewanella sp. D64]MEC4736337.1 Maf-like protein [Shewanella sp. E94]WBJ97602.1 Maf-like protein [Shewanella sp. MTB7]